MLLATALFVIGSSRGEATAFGRRQGDKTGLIDDAEQYVGGGQPRQVNSCLNDKFSGFHTLREEDKYSGAWLTSAEYFKTTNPTAVGNLEGASHEVAGHYTRAISMSTTDHFDFWLEHLSSYSDQCFPRGWNDMESEWSPLEGEMLEDLKRRSKLHTRTLNTSCAASQSKEALTGKRIIAMMPYRRGRGIVGETRPSFFKAAFWSAWAHGFDKIVVSVCTKSDYEFVKTFPAFRILKFYELYDPNTHYHCEILPRKTLDYVHKQLNSRDNDWQFDYVYYNEADQVTHLRSPKQIFDWVDEQTSVDGQGNSGEKSRWRVALPHRIHTRPLLGDFPPQLQEKLTKERGDLLPNRTVTKWEEFWSSSCCHVPYPTEGRKRPSGFCKKHTYSLAGGFPFCAVTEHKSYCNPTKTLQQCDAV